MIISHQLPPSDSTFFSHNSWTPELHANLPMARTKSTLGHHIARRLVQIGITDVFCVPGEFNLNLFDQLIAAEPELNLVGCCYELNAGYAADGYARSRGIGTCVVAFNVGGLSLLNAIAGATVKISLLSV